MEMTNANTCFSIKGKLTSTLDKLWLMNVRVDLNLYGENNMFGSIAVNLKISVEIKLTKDKSINNAISYGLKRTLCFIVAIKHYVFV